MSIADEPTEDKRKRPPFAAIPWSVVDAKLSPHDLAVYVAIVRHANRNGQCWPSVDKLAEVAVVTTRFVRDSVKRLQGRGLLTITPKVNRPHVYTLNMVQGTLNTVQGEGECGSGHPEYGSPKQEPMELEPLEEPLKKARSSAKAFLAPSVEQVREYVARERLTINPEEFVDYYESNGWKVGRSPMKDWQAAVRQWSRRQKQFALSNKPKSARSQPGTGAGVLFDPTAATSDPSYGDFG